MISIGRRVYVRQREWANIPVEDITGTVMNVLNNGELVEVHPDAYYNDSIGETIEYPDVFSKIWVSFRYPVEYVLPIEIERKNHERNNGNN